MVALLLRLRPLRTRVYVHTRNLLYALCLEYQEGERAKGLLVLHLMSHCSEIESFTGLRGQRGLFKTFDGVIG